MPTPYVFTPVVSRTPAADTDINPLGNAWADHESNAVAFPEQGFGPKTAMASGTDQLLTPFGVWTPFGGTGTVLLDFTKVSDVTRVRVDVRLSWWTPDGTSGIKFAINVVPASGSITLVEIFRTFANNSAGAHTPMHAWTYLPAALLYPGKNTAIMYWQLQSGTEFRRDASDYISITAREMF